jgi:hypothetical protein
VCKSEFLSGSIFLLPKKLPSITMDVTQVVESLHNKCKALNSIASNPRTTTATFLLHSSKYRGADDGFSLHLIFAFNLVKYFSGYEGQGWARSVAQVVDRILA